MSLVIVNIELFRYLGLQWDVTISWLVIKMSMPEDISGMNLFSSFLSSEFSLTSAHAVSGRCAESSGNEYRLAQTGSLLVHHLFV